MNRRRFITSAALTAAAIGTGAVITTGEWSPNNANAAATQDNSASPDPLETATVRRGSLSMERTFNAVVSHGDPWTINTAATGTITDAHEAGTIVELGDELIRIDDKPLTLAPGTMPMYRELHKIDTRGRDQNGNRLRRQTGPDVSQLQAFLLGEGFDADGRLEIDGEFGGYTETAVEAWQESVGLPVTGRVDSSQLVFATDAVRLDTTSRIGDPFTTLDATSADAKVLVDTSTRDRSALPVGTTVEIDINGTISSGTVADQEQITSADGSRIWRTTITADGQLPTDVASAKVTVTETVADDVLLVPVSALLALSEGGFAVEIPDGATTRLIPVKVGEVLDGDAEIDGDIIPGDTVVIPT